MAVQTNASVIRAFAILRLFSESRPELSAAVVAEELGLGPVTAHRFLRTLEQVGVLVTAGRGRYRPGYLLVDLAERALHHAEIARALQPVLGGIARDLDEACMATAFEADTAVCIARAVSRRSLSVHIRIGSRLEGYCSASGKVWLAGLSEPGLERYLEVVPRPPLTPTTIVGRDALLQEIAVVRDRGWADNDGEREEGIRSVAVPLTTRSGRMVAGLSVFGPTVRLTEEVLVQARRRLLLAVEEAREALYGRRER